MYRLFTRRLPITRRQPMCGTARVYNSVYTALQGSALSDDALLREEKTHQQLQSSSEPRSE